MLTDIILIMLMVLVVVDNVVLFKINKYLCLFFILLFFYFMQSMIQVLFYGAKGVYIFDILKIAKVLVFLLLISLQLRIDDKIRNILTVYIIVDVVVSLIQMFYPSTALFSLFSFDTHLKQMSERPFGLLENSTQAGFVSVALLYIFEVLKDKRMIYLSIFSVLLHTNKMSILVAVMIHCYFYFRDMQYLSYRSIISISLSVPLSVCIFILLVFISPNVSSFILRMLETGIENNDTYIIRMRNFSYAYNLYVEDFFKLVFIGYPYKELWPKAFDSQYLLLNFRYGLIGLLVIYFSLYQFLKKEVMFFFVLLIASLTMINFYHVKSSLLVGVLVYFIYTIKHPHTIEEI